jgi:hypothetical protein
MTFFGLTETYRIHGYELLILCLGISVIGWVGGIFIQPMLVSL